MPKTAVLNIRIDPFLKTQVEELYHSFGITVTDAVNMFFNKSVMVGGLPFDLSIPPYKKEIIEAMQESERLSRDPNAKRFSRVDDLFEDLNNHV
jgi:DNA-damage-inducible protein J